MLFRGGNYNEQESIARLNRVLETIPNEELPYSIVVIEKGRIRRRRLPLEPLNHQLQLKATKVDPMVALRYE